MRRHKEDDSRHGRRREEGPQPPDGRTGAGDGRDEFGEKTGAVPAPAREVPGQPESGEEVPEDAGSGRAPEPARPSGRGDGGGRADRKSPEEEAAEYLEQLQRLKAEFDNYRKRTNREREEWFATARAEAVSRLLGILDDVHRARAHGAAENPETAGLWMILKRFEDVLTQLGLEEQKTEPGAEFDPELYEAVLTAPSEEIPEGRVVRAIEPGYFFQGRLLRPSKVAVSSGPAAGVERAL